jgi:hypothetical protein
MKVGTTNNAVFHRIMGTPGEGLAAIFGAGVGIIAVRFRAGNARSVLAEVSGGTGITIFAGSIAGGEETSDLGVARVIRAGIGIVTGEDDAAGAGSVQTDRIHGARIPIVARALGIDCCTSQLQVAEILGACVAVIAFEQTATGTESGITMVTHGTKITVIAIGRVGYEAATRLGIARIVGAGIGIIADQFATTDALSQVTVVTGTADTAIIAWGRIQAVDTAGGGVATVGRAHVVVVALGQPSMHTDPSSAVVAHSAGIAIAARSLVCHVLTHTAIIATIIRARVHIVAIVPGPRNAHPVQAEIPHSAGIAVVTSPGSGGMGTANCWTAAILGTRVVIIAIQEPGKAAFALTAQIADRTRIAVATGCLIGHEEATGLTVTTIVGADIAVVAQQRRATDTCPTSAHIARGAGIAIVADGGIVQVLATVSRVATIVRAGVVICA